MRGFGETYVKCGLHGTTRTIGRYSAQSARKNDATNTSERMMHEEYVWQHVGPVQSPPPHCFQSWLHSGIVGTGGYVGEGAGSSGVAAGAGSPVEGWHCSHFVADQTEKEWEGFGEVGVDYGRGEIDKGETPPDNGRRQAGLLGRRAPRSSTPTTFLSSMFEQSMRGLHVSDSRKKHTKGSRCERAPWTLEFQPTETDTHLRVARHHFGALPAVGAALGPGPIGPTALRVRARRVFAGWVGRGGGRKWRWGLRRSAICKGRPKRRARRGTNRRARSKSRPRWSGSKTCSLPLKKRFQDVFCPAPLLTSREADIH